MIITGNRRCIPGRETNAGTDSSNNGQVLYHCIHYRNVHKMDCVWIQEIFYRCVVLAWLCYRWGKIVTPFLIIAIYLVYNTLCFIEFTVSLPDSLSVNVNQKNILNSVSLRWKTILIMVLILLSIKLWIAAELFYLLLFLQNTSNNTLFLTLTLNFRVELIPVYLSIIKINHNYITLVFMGIYSLIKLNLHLDFNRNAGLRTAWYGKSRCNKSHEDAESLTTPKSCVPVGGNEGRDTI